MAGSSTTALIIFSTGIARLLEALRLKTRWVMTSLWMKRG